MNARCYSVILMLSCFLSGAWAEVVEEETWYDSAGKVVKTVTRTYTRADAVRSPSWEPAWIAREREQARRLRGGSIRYRGSSWGYSSWGSGYGWYPSSYGYRRGYACRTPYRSGLGVSYRSGNWSFGFRSGYGCGCRTIAY